MSHAEAAQDSAARPEDVIRTAGSADGALRRLELTTGVGRGPTRLSAFDAALRAAGIANFNLIRLSSVIPPGSVVVRPAAGNARPAGEWGDRLYAVISESIADVPNQEAWAGIGWAQESATGKGLFVEHAGHSEASVRRDIEKSLEALFAGRRMPLQSPSMEVAGIECRDSPVSALVAAVFISEPWLVGPRQPSAPGQRRRGPAM